MNLLKRLNPDKITIAGFDGFSNAKEDNYVDSGFQNDRHIVEFDLLNKEISEMYNDIKATLEGKCEVKLLTASLYGE